MQPKPLGRPLGRPRAILKDWDGTIVDSLQRVHDVHNEILRDLGMREVTFDETIRITAYGADGGIHVLGVTVEQNEILKTRFMDIFYSDITRQLMPGAHEFMAAITASTLPLGVVSNKHSHILRQEMVHFGWAEDRFAGLVGSGDAGKNKPNPEPALMALSQMGLQPGKDIWFVGDSHGDIGCALAAGLTAILVTTHDYDGPEPCFRFPDLHALLGAYHDLTTDEIHSANAG